MRTPAALTVFVYFRDSPDARDRTVAALERHFALVAQRCGVRGHGALRHDRDKPYLTWLEIYEAVAPDRLDEVLAAIDASALEIGLAGFASEGRHREVFEAVSAA